MFGLTQTRTLPQQSIGLSGFPQQDNGLDISSILNLMIPIMMLGMMMKMMTGAFGEGNSKKLKPVETAS